jgi:hypothetical protein
MATYTKDQIKTMLETRNVAVIKGILAIFAYQTATEQTVEETNQSNGVGFNGVDAPIMSSFAKQLQNGRTLSEKQMVLARKRIIKYAGQLLRIANEKAGV